MQTILTLKERYHGDKSVIIRFTLPFRDNDGVFGLKLNVVWDSIQHDDF
jgi:hypothetical protein